MNRYDSVVFSIMKIHYLDLRGSRCPMALLLAKRAAINLSVNQQLQLDVSDAGAMSDIPRYFRTQGYCVQIQKNEHMTRIVVSK